MQMANPARRQTKRFVIGILGLVAMAAYVAIRIPESLTPPFLVSLLVVALGGALNYFAAATNGWYMPVRVIRERTRRAIEKSSDHSEMMPTTRFRPLCDVLNFGITMGSIGDLIALVGFVSLMIVI